MHALLPGSVYVFLIGVTVTPSVRTTLVHLGTSAILPFRVDARAVIIVVAPVVALPVCGAHLVDVLRLNLDFASSASASGTMSMLHYMAFCSQKCACRHQGAKA
jgi:hypothetical protein